MKLLTNSILALLFGATCLPAAASVTLTCVNELSGMEETITVPGNNADEAKNTMRLDPQYGYWFAPSCMELNTDRPGGDLGEGFDLNSPDPRLCQMKCKQNPSCKAWTYVKPNTIQGPHPRCWLKGSVPGARNSNCCISGPRPK